MPQSNLFLAYLKIFTSPRLCSISVVALAVAGIYLIQSLKKSSTTPVFSQHKPTKGVINLEFFIKL